MHFQITYSDQSTSRHLSAISAKKKFDSFYGTNGVIVKIWCSRYGILTAYELAEFARIERRERAHNRRQGL